MGNRSISSVAARTAGVLLLLAALPPARGEAARLPASHAHVQLEPGGHARIPFIVKTQHIRVRGTLGDSDSLWFVIDTGAQSSVLDDSVARTLGLRVVGTYEAHGAGGAQAGIRVAAPPIHLPGLTIRRKQLDATSLRPLGGASGQPIDLILGYELFHDCVVRFDYDAGVMDVWDRRHAPHRLTGATVPMTLVSHHPYVEAEIDFPGRAPLTGRWVIDTGAAGALSITPEFVERDSLAAALPRTLEILGRGVGGESHYRTGRVDAFKLGALTFDHPIAVLTPPGPGRIAVPGAVGNIGGQVLSRCSITFDYRHRLVAFEPNAKFSQPFESDMSGATLLHEGPDFVVRLVNPDTPAAEAGLEEGDRVTAIDGTPSASLDLSALRTHFSGIGRSVQLDVTRGDRHFTATVVLRRII